MKFFKKIWLLLSKPKFRRGSYLYVRAFLRSAKTDTRERAIADFKYLLENDCMQDSNMERLRPTILEQLGISYHWNNQCELAEQTLREALKLSTKHKSKSPELFAYLGHICKKKGDLEEALMFYGMALDADKDRPVDSVVVDMAKVLENKDFLDKYKDRLPFASAYIKQQKQKDN